MKKYASWKLCILYLVTAALLSCNAAFAENTTGQLEITPADGGFNISAQFDRETEFVTLLITYPGAQIEKKYDDTVDITDIVNEAEIIELNASTLSYDHFIGSDGPFGEYTVYIRENENVYQKSYRYTKSTEEYKTELFEAINVPGADITGTLLKYNDVVLLDEEFLKNAGELKSHFEYLVSGLLPIKNKTDIDGFLSGVSKIEKEIKILYNINAAASAEEISEILCKNKSEAGIFFDAADEYAKAVINELEKPLNNIDVFEKMNRAYVLKKINASSWGAYDGILKTYDIFGIDTDKELENISPDKQEEMYKNMAESSPFESVEQYAQAFYTQRDNVKNTANNTAGGGGGGGGGGVSSAKTAAAQAYVPAQTQTDLKAAEFEDTYGVPWAKEAIDYLQKINAVSGVSETRFEPDRNVNREEFVKMVMNSFGYAVASGKPRFLDVESGAWHENYVYTADAEGIVNGISETEFGIGKNVTRQDAAVIIVRAAEKKNKLINVTSGGKMPGDENKISDYALESVTKLFKAGVLGGDENGNFNPEESLTRAAAAKMIYYCLKSI